MTIDARYLVKTARVVDCHLHISWVDGHSSRYHPMWLRHQCECDDCGSSLDGVRGIRIHHIPEDIHPIETVVNDETVSIVWNNDRHTSDYCTRWLRDNCYSDRERAARKHLPSLWDRISAERVDPVDFVAAESDQSVRLKCLETVADYGFCPLINMPKDLSESHRPIALVGDQRTTHYGTYTLGKKRKVRNVGDVTGPLDPHSDETYRMSTIGITVFQVLRPSSDGGASTLMDGFEAVRRLRESFPDDYELLCRTPVTTQRFDDFSDDALPKWYVSRQPWIKVDEDNDVCGVRINERQIAPLDMPGDSIESFYAALRRLMQIVYDPELRITFPLQAGEGLLFNNQRVLHGRTAYKAEQPGRSVLTSSVDLEEFYSTIRVLKLQQGHTGPALRYAQGMVF
ncbi:MAG: TauD/TfdA family dioxygenase [Pseudomonadota bacterium]